MPILSAMYRRLLYKRKAGTTALLALMFALVLLAAHQINFHFQKERVAQRVDKATQEINEQITSVQSLVRSLKALHEISTNLNNYELSVFAQQLRENASFVGGIGRYLQVGYTSSLETEYRISSFETSHRTSVMLLGKDLKLSDQLSPVLDQLTNQHTPLLTTRQGKWPADGELLLFQPVYSNYRGPETLDEEQAYLSTGGFWISIDLKKILDTSIPYLSDLDVAVSLIRDESESIVFERMADLEQATFLDFLYPAQSYAREWPNVHNTLKITLQKNIGYSPAVLMALLMTLSSLVLLAKQYQNNRLHRQQQALERERNLDALFREREKAEKTLNAVQDSIISLDEKLCISHLNPAAVIQFNAKPGNAIGMPLAHVVQFQLAGNHTSVFNVEAALRNLAHNSKGDFDVVPLGQSHEEFVLRLTLTSCRGHDGEISGHVLVIRDISHECRLTARLSFQANHDALTGCINRYGFEQTLAGLIDELSLSQDGSHALCYMDLDQFKIVNDTCGHRAGDRLLRELTRDMREIIRDGDVLSRLGGDEFGLLLIDVEPEQIKVISTRLFDFFQNYMFYHEGQSFAVRASIGIVHIDKTCSSMKDVMAAADIACFAAKDAGRNSMYVYSPTDDTLSERTVELSWLPRLQNALQNDEFKLYLQPVDRLLCETSGVSITTEPAHFEFLLRLTEEDGSEITPWQFIQAAERYDLMRDIDKWVIRNALRTVAELQGGPGGRHSYSINLSGQSAADPSMKSFLADQLALYQVDPSLIWFELTETAAISHFSVAVELMNSIHELGCKVALDDFGSGLSSFGYLKNLPIDVIKIDGQFVLDIASNTIDKEMVKAIRQLALAMNITTVAEFVENQEILDVLGQIGIDYAQGFHIGHPKSIQATMARLGNDWKDAA